MAPQENCRTKAAWCKGAALVVLLSGALVGCNSGDGSRPAETPPPAVTESASSSPAPTAAPAVYKPADATGPAQNVPVPVLPELAKTETKEGLEAFVKYWYASLGYAYETGDTQRIEAISEASCSFCFGLRDAVHEAWAEGRWISGAKIETPVISVTVRPGNESSAIVQVLQQEIVIRSPNGDPYQNPTAASNTGSRAAASFKAGNWTISDLGLIR